MIISYSSSGDALPPRPCVWHQRDHWLGDQPIPCDLAAVGRVEKTIKGLVARCSTARLSLLLSSLPLPSGWTGTPAVPLVAFLAFGRIPCVEDGLSRHYSDSELESKRIFHISHRNWPAGEVVAQSACLPCCLTM